jgi:DNA-binding NtrC family response regulator
MATILVVDDEAQQREQIDRALVQAGHQVEVACSGNQAVSRLKEKRYHLLITDLLMDDGTGFEVLEWVRENAPGLPVLVCSSYAKPDNLKTFLTTHLYRILRKPFRLDELLGQAKELLG